MSEMVKIGSLAEDRFEFNAIHAAPQGERRGGVVVLQEIFGLDSYIREDVERWSKRGFEVLAPALFDRSHPGLDVPHDEAGYAVAVPAMNAAQPATLLGDVGACVASLSADGPVFLVGYCFGGDVAWQAACRLESLAAVSAYYGRRIGATAELEPKCPVICHFGRKDPHIPAEETEVAIHNAHSDLPVYIYENSGHGFNNDGRPDSDAVDAEAARDRTLALFAGNGAG